MPEQNTLQDSDPSIYTATAQIVSAYLEYVKGNPKFQSMSEQFQSAQNVADFAGKVLQRLQGK